MNVPDRELERMQEELELLRRIANAAERLSSCAKVVRPSGAAAAADLEALIRIYRKWETIT